MRRLDPSTRESWAIHEENVQGFSTYADLLKFLEAPINSLTPPAESSESRSKPASKPHLTITGKPQSKSNAEKQITSHVTQQQSAKPKQRTPGKGKSDFKCLFCPESHGPFKCEKFLNLNAQERVKLVKSKKLCENCSPRNTQLLTALVPIDAGKVARTRSTTLFCTEKSPSCTQIPH